MNEIDSQLFEAVQLENLEKVTQLIKADADVNAKDTDEETPLHKAAEKGSYKTAALLIKAGADVNAKSVSGTPLNYATYNCHYSTAALLIKAGADVNAKDKTDYTSLDHAIPHKNTKLMKLLITNGAEINLVKYKSQNNSSKAFIEVKATYYTIKAHQSARTLYDQMLASIPLENYFGKDAMLHIMSYLGDDNLHTDTVKALSTSVYNFTQNRYNNLSYTEKLGRSMYNYTPTMIHNILPTKLQNIITEGPKTDFVRIMNNKNQTEHNKAQVYSK